MLSITCVVSIAIDVESVITVSELVELEQDAIDVIKAAQMMIFFISLFFGE